MNQRNAKPTLHPAHLVSQLGWWLLLAVCALFSIYALVEGAKALLVLLGIAVEARERGAPILFVVHALAGSVALMTAPLQLNRRLLIRYRRLHRLLGRLYVGAVWVSSAGGLWSAIFFNVHLFARVAFALLAILWFAVTTIGYQRIRQRQVREHREWMIRSFALSFFFVTGSFTMPALAGTSLPVAVAAPLGVVLGWLPNLLVAETWIRWTLRRSASEGLDALAPEDRATTRKKTPSRRITTQHG